MMAIDTHSLLSKCVHSVQRTRRCCGRIVCYSVQLALCVMAGDDGTKNASIEVVQSNARSQHTTPQEVGIGSGRASA